MTRCVSLVLLFFLFYFAYFICATFNFWKINCKIRSSGARKKTKSIEIIAHLSAQWMIVLLFAKHVFHLNESNIFQHYVKLRWKSIIIELRSTRNAKISHRQHLINDIFLCFDSVFFFLVSLNKYCWKNHNNFHRVARSLESWFFTLKKNIGFSFN